VNTARAMILQTKGDLAKESSDLKQLIKVMYSKVLAALCLVGNMERSLFV